MNIPDKNFNMALKMLEEVEVKGAKNIISMAAAFQLLTGQADVKTDKKSEEEAEDGNLDC